MRSAPPPSSQARRGAGEGIADFRPQGGCGANDVRAAASESMIRLLELLENEFSNKRERGPETGPRNRLR